jgi:UDP-N-acetylmuramoyl-tripeptide--D-alanyl-D-alanine ligase
LRKKSCPIRPARTSSSIHAGRAEKLGKYYRSLFDIPFIGVVGSVGKTSTKEMIASVLSEKYSVLKTPENLNNEIGVPLTLLSLREEHEAAIIEMGISDFGEMSRLADMVRPDICVMTNIGYCHLENLIDLDGVLRAKSEIFSFMSPDSFAVLNGDDELLSSFDPKIKKLSFGFGGANDVRAENVKNLGYGGTGF